MLRNAHPYTVCTEAKLPDANDYKTPQKKRYAHMASICEVIHLLLPTV